MSTEDVIDRFLDNQCADDPDRYLYRNPQVARFLEQASMDVLRGPEAPEVSTVKIAMDDGNNSNVTRGQIIGKRRQFQGGLNAQQLYNELLKPVSLKL